MKRFGATYVEKLADAGLRLVGYADEISKSIRHKGWFTDDDSQDETLRGAVVQLPGRKGHAVLLPAYWESMTGGYIVDYSDVTYVKAESDDLSDLADTCDVARVADGMAERAAETERDYQAAWRLGQQYAELQAESESLRDETRRILRDFRFTRKRVTGMVEPAALETMCAVITKQVRQNLYRLLRTRTERDVILRDNTFRGDLASAFNEGAGVTVI